MVNPKQVIAQSFYLAQLQACKGKCKCNVCELLRKASDAMTEEVLSGNPGVPVDPASLVAELEGLGYGITPPGARGDER